MQFDKYAQNFKDGRFDSPLRYCLDAELNQIIRVFHRTPGLSEILSLEELRRGALQAQDPDSLQRPDPTSSDTASNADPDARFENSSEAEQAMTVAHELAAVDPPPDPAALDSEDRLTLREVDALDREENGELRSLTKDIIIVLAACAMGAIVQGWSQESIVGANLHWPVDVGIAHQNENDNWKFNDEFEGSRIFGLVNSIPYFAASFVGVWIIDPISAFYGRRGALLFAALCSFVAPIGASYCNKWGELFACRLVQGIGMGAKASVVPVLESEVCPPRMRGRLLVLWQTFVAVGIVLGAAANCIFQGQWRHQIGIAFVPSVPLMCLCYIIPESPRWLIKKGKYPQAYQVLTKLRETPLQAARDLFEIYAQVKLELVLYSKEEIPSTRIAQLLVSATIEEREQPTKRLDFFRRLGQLFTIKRNLRAVIGSCVVMIAQQFSGFNIFAFLATTVLSDAISDETTNLGLNFGLACSNAVFSALAFFMVEYMGRRTLLLTSLVVMFPLLLITGRILEEHHSVAAVVVVVVIVAAVYSPGAGVIPFMYSSEVFGQTHREIGMSLAVAVNLALAGVLAMVVPLYQRDYDSPNGFMHLLGVFAGLDGLAAILVYLFMRTPGTSASLEDMNFLFGASTHSYIAYQIQYVAPLTIRKCWPFGKREYKDPFGDWQQKRRIRSGSQNSVNSDQELNDM